MTDKAERRGWNESLGNGIRKDHRVACKSSQDRKPNRKCACPYSYSLPDPSRKGGQRRARSDGSLSLRSVIREKQRRAEDARRKIAIGHSAPVESPTLFEWYQHCMKKAWADRAHETREIRRRSYENYIHDPLGHRRLDAITPLVVASWFDDVVAADGGNLTRTIEQAGESLRAAFGVAERLELVDRNPVKSIPRRKPTEGRRPRHVLTHEQLAELRGACETMEELCLIRVASECCLRRGELCALTWADIDTSNNLIAVTKTLHRNIGGGYEVAPRKSGGAAYPAMHVSLNRDLALLRMERDNSAAKDTDYVWPGRGPRDKGWSATHPMTPDALTRRVKRIGNRIQLRVTPHALRHTGASIAAANGVPDVVLQHQLGHASARTTLEHYVHLADRTTLRSFSDALQGNVSGVMQER